jgi:hypothetical protein
MEGGVSSGVPLDEHSQPATKFQTEGVCQM